MHTWTFAAAIPGVVALLLMASGAAATTGAAIYGGALLLAFGTSAGYHRLAHGERARRVMQRLDHSAIFVLIAGTYAPVCLVGLPRAWGIPLLAVVGAGAVIGIVCKQFGVARVRVVEHALYPLLGWAALAVAPVLARHLSGPELALLVAGGVLYTAGIPVLVRGRPDPWPRTFGYHEIWHACTVAAGACHFAAVGMLVR